jgi:hypothetical protein
VGGSAVILFPIHGSSDEIPPNGYRIYKKNDNLLHRSSIDGILIPDVVRSQHMKIEKQHLIKKYK